MGDKEESFTAADADSSHLLAERGVYSRGYPASGSIGPPFYGEGGYISSSSSNSEDGEEHEVEDVVDVGNTNTSSKVPVSKASELLAAALIRHSGSGVKLPGNTRMDATSSLVAEPELNCATDADNFAMLTDAARKSIASTRIVLDSDTGDIGAQPDMSDSSSDYTGQSMARVSPPIPAPLLPSPPPPLVQAMQSSGGANRAAVDVPPPPPLPEFVLARKATTWICRKILSPPLRNLQQSLTKDRLHRQQASTPD